MSTQSRFRPLTPSANSYLDMFWFAEQVNWLAYPCKITHEVDFLVEGVTEVGELRYNPSHSPQRISAIVVDMDRPILRIPMKILYRLLTTVNKAQEAYISLKEISLSSIPCDFDLVLCSRHNGCLVRVSPLILLEWAKMYSQYPNDWPQFWAGLEWKIEQLTQENHAQDPDPVLSLDLTLPTAKIFYPAKNEWFYENKLFLKEVWTLPLSKYSPSPSIDAILKNPDQIIQQRKAEFLKNTALVVDPLSIRAYLLPLIQTRWEEKTTLDLAKNIPNPLTTLKTINFDTQSLEWRWNPVLLSPLLLDQYKNIQQILHDSSIANPNLLIPYLRQEGWQWKDYHLPDWLHDSKLPSQPNPLLCLSIVDPSHDRVCPPKYSQTYNNILFEAIITKFQPDHFLEIAQAVPNYSADFQNHLLPKMDLWRYKFMYFYSTTTDIPLEFVETYNQLFLFREMGYSKQWVLVRFLNQSDQYRDFPFPLQSSILLLTGSTQIRLFSVEIDREIYREEDPELFQNQLKLYWEDFEGSLKQHFIDGNKLHSRLVALDLVMHKVVTSGYMTQHYYRNPTKGILKAIQQFWHYNAETQAFDEISGQQLREYKKTIQTEMDQVSCEQDTTNSVDDTESAKISANIAELLHPSLKDTSPSTEFIPENINESPDQPKNSPIPPQPSSPSLQPVETIFHLALHGVEDPAKIPLQATFVDPTMFQQNRPKLPTTERVWEIRYDLASLLNDQWILKQLQLLPGQILDQMLINATGDPPIPPNQRPTDPKITTERTRKRFQRQNRSNYPQAFFVPTMRRTTLSPLVVESPEKITEEKIILLYDSQPLSSLTMDQRTKIQQVYQLEWRDLSPASMVESFHRRRKTGYSKRLTVIKTKIAQKSQPSAKNSDLEPFLEYLHYNFDSDKPHTISQLAEVFRVAPSTIFRILTTPLVTNNSNTAVKTKSQKILQSIDTLIADFVSTNKEGEIFEQIKDALATQTAPEKVDELAIRQVTEMLREYTRTQIRCPADHARFLKRFALRFKIPATNIAKLLYDSGVEHPQNQSLISQIETILAEVAQKGTNLLVLFRQFYPPQNNRTFIHDLKNQAKTPLPQATPSFNGKKIEEVDTMEVMDSITQRTGQIFQKLHAYSTLRNKIVDSELEIHRSAHPAQPYNHLANIIDGIEQYFTTHDTIDPALRGFVEFQKYLRDGESPTLLHANYDPTDPAFETTLEAVYDLYMALQWMHHYFIDSSEKTQTRLIQFLTLILHEDPQVIEAMVQKMDTRLWEEQPSPSNKNKKQVNLTHISDKVVEKKSVLGINWGKYASENVAGFTQIMENLLYELQISPALLVKPITIEKIPLKWTKEVRTLKMKAANIFHIRQPTVDPKNQSNRYQLLQQIGKMDTTNPFFEHFGELFSQESTYSKSSPSISQDIKEFLSQFEKTLKDSKQDMERLAEWMQQYFQYRQKLTNSIDIYPIIKTSIELVYSLYFYRISNQKQGVCFPIEAEFPDLKTIKNNQEGLDAILTALIGFKSPSNPVNFGILGNKLRYLYLEFMKKYDAILDQLEINAKLHSTNPNEYRPYFQWKKQRQSISQIFARTVLRLCYRRPLGDLCKITKNSFYVIKDLDAPLEFKYTCWVDPSEFESKTARSDRRATTKETEWRSALDSYLLAWVHQIFESTETSSFTINPASHLTVSQTTKNLVSSSLASVREEGLIRSFKTMCEVVKEVSPQKISTITNQITNPAISEKEDDGETDDDNDNDLESENLDNPQDEPLLSSKKADQELDSSKDAIEKLKKEVQDEEDAENDTDVDTTSQSSSTTIDLGEDEKPLVFKPTESQINPKIQLSEIMDYCSETIQTLKEPIFISHPYEIREERLQSLSKALLRIVSDLLVSNAFPLDFSHFAIISRLDAAYSQLKQQFDGIDDHRAEIIQGIEDHIRLLNSDSNLKQSLSTFTNGYWNTNLITQYGWKKENLQARQQKELQESRSPIRPFYSHYSQILAKTSEWFSIQVEILTQIQRALIQISDPQLKWITSVSTFQDPALTKEKCKVGYLGPLEQIRKIKIQKIVDPQIKLQYEQKVKLLYAQVKACQIQEPDLEKFIKYPDDRKYKGKLDTLKDAYHLLCQEYPSFVQFIAQNATQIHIKDPLNDQAKLSPEKEWPPLSATALDDYIESYSNLIVSETEYLRTKHQDLKTQITQFNQAFSSDPTKPGDLQPYIFFITELLGELKELQQKPYLCYITAPLSAEAVPFLNRMLRLRVISKPITSISEILTEVLSQDIQEIIYRGLEQVFPQKTSNFTPTKNTIQDRENERTIFMLQQTIADLVKQGIQEINLLLSENPENGINFRHHFGNPLVSSTRTFNSEEQEEFLRGLLLDLVRLEQTMMKFFKSLPIDLDQTLFPNLSSSIFYRWKNWHQITLTDDEGKKKQTEINNNSKNPSNPIMADSTLTEVFHNKAQCQWLTSQITQWTVRRNTKSDESKKDIFANGNLNPSLQNIKFRPSSVENNLLELMAWVNLTSPKPVDTLSNQDRIRFSAVKEVIQRYRGDVQVHTNDEILQIKEWIKADLSQYQSLNYSFIKDHTLSSADFNPDAWASFQAVLYDKKKISTAVRTVAVGLKLLLDHPPVATTSYFEIFARQILTNPSNEELPPYTEKIWVQPMERNIRDAVNYVIEFTETDPKTITSQKEYYCFYQIGHKTSTQLLFGYHVSNTGQFAQDLQRIFSPLPYDPNSTSGYRVKIIRFDQINRSIPLVTILNDFCIHYAILDRFVHQFYSSDLILYLQPFGRFDFLGMLQTIKLKELDPVKRAKLDQELTPELALSSFLKNSFKDAFPRQICEQLEQLFGSSYSFQNLQNTLATLGIQSDKFFEYLVNYELLDKFITPLKTRFQKDLQSKIMWQNLANFRKLCGLAYRLRIIEAIFIKHNMGTVISLNKKYIDNVFQFITILKNHQNDASLDFKEIETTFGNVLPALFYSLAGIYCDVSEIPTKGRRAFGNVFQFPSIKIDRTGDLYVLQPYDKLTCFPTSNNLMVSATGGDMGLLKFNTSQTYATLNQQFQSEDQTLTVKFSHRNPYKDVQDLKNEWVQNDSVSTPIRWNNMANALGKQEITSTFKFQRTAEKQRAKYKQLVASRQAPWEIQSATGKIRSRSLHRVRGNLYGSFQKLTQKQQNKNRNVAHVLARNFIRQAEDMNTQIIQLTNDSKIQHLWTECLGPEHRLETNQIQEFCDLDLQSIRTDLSKKFRISSKKIDEYSAYFESKLISAEDSAEKRLDLIYENIRKQMLFTVNTLCRISLEDLSKYRAVAGESYALEKASWLRGLFPRYVAELARLKGINMILIPPAYTSKIAHATGKEGIIGFYVKIIPLKVNPVEDKDYRIMLLDSSKITTETQISSGFTQKYNSQIEKILQLFRNSQIPLDEIWSGKPLLSLIKTVSSPEKIKQLQNFMNQTGLTKTQSLQSLFDQTGVLSHFDLNPLVIRRILLYYRKQLVTKTIQPTDMFFVPIKSGNLMLFEKADATCWILDRDINAARNIARYSYWQSIHQICQLQIDRLNPPSSQFLHPAYHGSVSGAQQKIRSGFRNAFIRLIEDYSYSKTGIGSLSAHLELKQFGLNQESMETFCNVMAQAFWYLFPRLGRKSLLKWMAELRALFISQEWWKSIETLSPDPNSDFSEILTFLKDKKVLADKWPELLNHSHTNHEVQLDQFLFQMWKELFTLRDNLEIPSRMIGLSHMILPKYATSKKLSSVTRYIQSFENWIVPFIKDAIDKG